MDYTIDRAGNITGVNLDSNGEGFSQGDVITLPTVLGMVIQVVQIIHLPLHLSLLFSLLKLLSICPILVHRVKSLHSLVEP